jgi:hypothetical protein
MGFFSLRNRGQTGSGAHPASYPMGTGKCYCGGGHEADHSPQSGAEVKNAWWYISTPPQYFFMTWCLVKHKNNFVFAAAHADMKAELDITAIATLCERIHTQNDI